MADNQTVTANQLREDLAKLGVESRLVLVHTSLKAVGIAAGGGQDLLDAWVYAVGAHGTVMFPTHTGGPDLSPANPARFDVRSTPSSRVGAMAEVARLDPNGRRSLHATHSVKLYGAQADLLAERHFSSETACDRQSPYCALADQDGLIALVGCGHGSNTTLHAAEEIAGVEYHLQSEVSQSVVISRDGRARTQPTRYHRWDTPRRFDRYDSEWTAAGIHSIHRVGRAEVRLVRAAAMMEFVLAELRRDPRALCLE